ncbi:MAG: acetylornithine transaminase [Proteobacteria bacterium]|nr:acetylornithine transaminase [Pseudomonadota bacterium]MBU4472196.1 acetylornithine transaminase [Pseudomonadota bacterium]MCG2750405.1 acetylornithine transaminase [Desulfobacteraceae bacterium]
MKTSIIEKADRVIAKTYSRFPVVMEKGLGCTLWDINGKEYTDFVAGIAVCNLGHCHPAVTEAICDQAARLLHVSNLYYTLPQVELAELLVENSFADRVFFGNSGAEANEAAIKLARKVFQDKGESRRYRIISMEKSFHGRTMATLSATGQEKIRKGFDPLLHGFDFVPFNDIQALENALNDSICAVMMEPIQGEGGIRCPDPEYLAAVRKLCDDKGILLIFDEIQTGMGRTGKLFAYEHYNMTPDIMTLAKALANGLPMGAMLAKESVAEAFGPGAHASTFGGTPIVASAAVAVMKTIRSDKILAHCRAMSAYLTEKLLALKEKHPVVVDVRGKGLLLGMKLSREGGDMVKACMERGYLINCVQGDILRFIPPLTVTEKDIDGLAACLDQVLALG